MLISSYEKSVCSCVTGALRKFLFITDEIIILFSFTIAEIVLENYLRGLSFVSERIFRDLLYFFNKGLNPEIL